MPGFWMFLVGFTVGLLIGTLAVSLWQRFVGHRHDWTAWTPWLPWRDSSLTGMSDWVIFERQRRCRRCGKGEAEEAGGHGCRLNPCPHREQFKELMGD